MFEKSLTQMMEAARKIEPMVDRFGEEIAEDARHLLSRDATLDSPLTDAAQIQTVRRIRSQVEDFEKELAELHQAILTAAQQIALTWVVPGDIETELKRVNSSSDNPLLKR